MNIAELIITLTLIGMIALALWFMRRRRKEGGCCGCGGNCSGCSASCSMRPENVSDQVDSPPEKRENL